MPRFEIHGIESGSVDSGQNIKSTSNRASYYATQFRLFFFLSVLSVYGLVQFQYQTTKYLENTGFCDQERRSTKMRME